MAARATWKGTLRISLVSIPVKMFTATEAAAGVSFNELHNACDTRLNHRKFCATCKGEVAASDVVKGFEHAPGQFITFTTDEIKTLEDAASNVLDVDQTTSDPIDPVMVDSIAFLVPDGAAAAPVFETILKALGKKRAVGTMVLRRRTVQVALEPRKHGLALYVLRGKEQVRTIEDLPSFPGATAMDAPSVKMAKELLDGLDGPLEYQSTRDDFGPRVRALVDAKLAGTAPPVVEPTVSAVLSLQEQLTQSLASTKKKTAKAELAPAAPAKTKKVG